MENGKILNGNWKSPNGNWKPSNGNWKKKFNFTRIKIIKKNLL